MQPQLLILVLPVGIITGLLAWAIPARRRYRADRASALNGTAGTVPLGSAGWIADAGHVPWRDLLEGLAVQPEIDTGAEAWMADMLGLRSKFSSSTTILEAHRMWGQRHGRTVTVRLGPDEAIEGNHTMFTNRHVRAITTVAVPVPAFEIVGEHGVLAAITSVPAPVQQVLAAIGPSEEIWDRVTLTAGPGGIVANRPTGADPLHRWLYDLWLGERLAWALGR